KARREHTLGASCNQPVVPPCLEAHAPPLADARFPLIWARIADARPDVPRNAAKVASTGQPTYLVRIDALPQDNGGQPAGATSSARMGAPCVRPASRSDELQTSGLRAAFHGCETPGWHRPRLAAVCLACTRPSRRPLYLDTTSIRCGLRPVKL